MTKTPKPLTRLDHIQSLQQLYEYCLAKDHDIRAHMPALLEYGRQVEHITEFGVRFGRSTAALLLARPKRMLSYDIEDRRFDLENYLRLARDAGVDFAFVKADVLAIDIEPTDLLFIDTFHTYRQLDSELARHADKARRFILLHDTTTYGQQGEDGAKPGLTAALHDFLAVAPEWRVRKRYDDENGLPVLARRDS